MYHMDMLLLTYFPQWIVIILQGWLAEVLQECLGDMVELESQFYHSLLNDYGIEGQLVDRNMLIHERDHKGDFMNLLPVILTSTWPG